MDTDIGGRLAEIVRRYGRHALTDPVALRAALRETGASLPAPEQDALAAVAGSPELADLLRRDGEAAPPADQIAARTGIPPGWVGWAWTALAEALRAGDRTATQPLAEPTLPPPDEYRVSWNAPPPTSPVRARRWPLAAAMAVVLAATAGGALWFVRAGGTAPDPPPPDRYAVDQVAQRYRALGARLLDGVTRCAQLPAAPGEVERVGCDVGTVSFTLATYDAASRLAKRREDVTGTGMIVRTARKVADGAAVVLQESRSGRSTVYWDTESPRPVSATVTADRTGLPALVPFFDARRFGALERPEVPGAAFASGVLWAFAEQWVNGERSARCRSVPVETPAASKVTEMVKCPLSDGAMLTFARTADPPSLTNTRVEYANDGGKVPGSIEVTVWNRNGGRTVGQLVRFVTSDDRSPGIYFDEESTRAYGVFFGRPGSSPDALLNRWQRALS